MADDDKVAREMRLNWSTIGVLFAIVAALGGFAFNFGQSSARWDGFSDRLDAADKSVAERFRDRDRRLDKIELTMDQNGKLEGAILVLSAKLENIQKQLDSMSGSLGKIIERGDRMTGQSTP